VHPAGIAVDLRRPPAGPCLSWLRDTLLVLEANGEIEVTEERRPPHFHIAVLRRPGTAPVPGLIDRLLAGQYPSVSMASLDGMEGIERRSTPSFVPLFRAALLPSESLGALTGQELVLQVEPTFTTESAGDVATADSVSVDSVTAPVPAAAKKEKPAPAKNRAKTHTVRSGDTLWDIAKKYDVSVRELQAANNLGRKARIKPKMKLKIPN
jgi:LysM repeat protein